MYHVTDAFLKALKTSPQHVVTTATVADPNTGAILATVPLATGGQVTIDRRQAFRRRVSFAVNDLDHSLTPVDPNSLLAPYGNEVSILRGLQFAGGMIELCPLGVFAIAKTVVVNAAQANRTLAIDGYDRGRRVSRARLQDYYSIAGGTNVGDAVLALIQFSVPSLTLFSFTATAMLTPADAPIVLAPNDDPWAAAIKLAASIGYELFFDPAGVLVFQPVVDPTFAPVVMVYQTGADSILTTVERTMNTDGVNSRVVANIVKREGTGSGVSPAVLGVAMDMNPTSPTYAGAGSKYGQVTDFTTSSLISTQAQADAAALADLNLMLGEAESARFGSMVNPAHEANDVIQLVDPAVNVNKFVVLDALTVPLDFGAEMAADTRIVARTS